MSDVNAEKIEGLLCAYVDGELDAIQRAQIERHLEANPQDRAMLQELIRLRADVQGLPRVAAPAEAGDLSQARMERSALLDGKFSGRRVAHWPRVAVAAVVVLAAGLAVVVWAVLSHGSSPRLVMSNPGPALAKFKASTTQESVVVATAAPATQEAAVAMNNRDLREADAGRGAAATGESLQFGAPATQNAPGAVVLAGNSVVLQRDEAKDVAPAVTLVVSTDNPSAAAGQVTQFLSDNRIAYRVAWAQDQLANADTTAANVPSPTQEAVAQKLTRAAEQAPAPRTDAALQAGYTARMSLRQAGQLQAALSQQQMRQTARMLPASATQQSDRSINGLVAPATAPAATAAETPVDVQIMFENPPAAPPKLSSP